MKKTGGLNSKVVSQTKAFLQSAKENGITIEKAFVFGSHVKGTARSDSDIDLCIVSKKFGKSYHDESVNLLRIAHQFEIPMDVIPFTPFDFKNKYDPLVREIQTYGVIIE